MPNYRSSPVRPACGALIGFIAFALLGGVTPASTAPGSEAAAALWASGFVVTPSPRVAELEPGETVFGPSWGYRAQVAAEHIAVRSLVRDLAELHSVRLRPAAAAGPGTITLLIDKAAGGGSRGAEVDAQSYTMRIRSDAVEIAGRSDAGLFYGVQTFLQLLKRLPDGRLVLPRGRIEDWPELPLRFLHWDTKHHQDKIETLKRFIDWSARFKINMIGFELEDKFEYPSHPVIGAPGAFTSAQLQELVNYALERFIQIVPQIQSPAHMAFVLKHPEFADLKADGNNYQACMCDERTYELIFSMYDDVIKATRGVKYFHVSTDEVYYAGICAKCTRPYNDENRSLQWIEFANRAHEFLKSRGRQMLAWVEYPVLAKHIQLLPQDLINAVQPGDEEQLQAEKARGMRQLIYTSLQGDELLFPDSLAATPDTNPPQGRVASTATGITRSSRVGQPVGVYGAAWDDSGLHNETFWLGWSTVAQYGWAPGGTEVGRHVASFMRYYYGSEVTGMESIYRGMQEQARFYERSWDSVVSRVRGPAYGNSNGKAIGTARYDLVLPPPSLPALPDLDASQVYTSGRYANLVEEARRMGAGNEELQGRLRENILKASRNRYNLEVFLSIASLVRHHETLLLGLDAIERSLAQAKGRHQAGKHEEALASLLSARRLASGLVAGRKAMLESVTKTWEQSRYPKGREVGGRKFLHVMDDTKDHVADRRADLSYLVAPEESIGLDEWIEKLTQVAREYSRRHSLEFPQGRGNDQ